MKIDMRLLLVVLQVTLVVWGVGNITTRGGWGDPNAWSGILLGFNFGAVVYGWLLYKQGQLLDEVLKANHSQIDFMLDMLKELVRELEPQSRSTKVETKGKVVAKKATK